MSKNRILLVEDDPNLGSLLQEYLQVKNYEVQLARDGEAGWEAYKNNSFDICIFDVMLPKKDGFTLAKEIRAENTQLPIVFLTAKGMIEDKIEGFNLGADDYLTKPFSMEELLLRLKAVLKRSASSAINADAPKDQFEIASFSFDYSTRNLTREGETRRITSREAELLRLLCINKNELLSREEALKLIWGDDSYFNARSMDVFITKLRKYLRPDTSIEIMNVHGTGYKLIVKTK